MPEQPYPGATLPYPLPGVQQSSASSATIRWCAFARAAGKDSLEERVFLQEDSHASIHPSFSHIARRSLRP
jgi:hypothetical protein